MSSAGVHKRSLVDWAVAARPVAGQVVSGDLHLVAPFDDGVLLAAIDGIGHGEQARTAAQAAVAILEKRPHESVISQVRSCHEALRETRGVAMTLASLHQEENTITWLGVGNVEGRLLRANNTHEPASESVLLRRGIVGYQLPALHASVIQVVTGDLLVLATDGIRAGFAESVDLSEPSQKIADRVLDQHFKETDDGLVLVARYLGMPHA